MLPPRFQALSQGVQKFLRFDHTMAAHAHFFDQLDLPGDPFLAHGNVAVGLGEMLPFVREA
ncbi:hypothetical protein [Microvirga massiliensis]|uniref:hypothetical protein n=1 Tax=Microvirga massiliensis TaxID=1033741 RepID=UPI0012B6AA56|nr:hypothetical protein [Microvirga massiliensis]